MGRFRSPEGVWCAAVWAAVLPLIVPAAFRRPLVAAQWSAPAPRGAEERSPAPENPGAYRVFSDPEEAGLLGRLARVVPPVRTRYVDESGATVTSERIRNFLTVRRSPMAEHSEAIVVAANRYGVDPRLVVAIAGVESGYGKRCRGFNAWGWNRGLARWHSWDQSIDSYTRLLAERYPNWRNVPRVARRYEPNTPEAWGRKVRLLMGAIGEGPD